MDIGELNRVIRIESRLEVREPVLNTPKEIWLPWASPVYARITERVPKGSTEETTNNVAIAKRIVDVRTRYLPGLTAAMRLVILDRGMPEVIMRIVTPPIEIDRMDGWDFTAEEWSTQGSAR
jgi:head-tail adaptor